MIVRAAAWMVMLMCLFAIAIILDIYRIERRAHKPAAALVMLTLASSLAGVGMLFAKCAYTGCFPRAPAEDCK